MAKPDERKGDVEHPHDHRRGAARDRFAVAVLQDLLHEARFYVNAQATRSVEAAKLLNRIDAALGGQ